MMMFCVYRNNNLYNNQAWTETKQQQQQQHQQQHQSDSVISSQTTTTTTTANPTSPATTTNIITNINNNTAKQQQKPDNSQQPANNRNERMRIFVALFDYDPPTMSPNPDACEEELPFREGQLIKVNVILCLLVRIEFQIFSNRTLYSYLFIFIIERRS